MLQLFQHLSVRLRQIILDHYTCLWTIGKLTRDLYIHSVHSNLDYVKCLRNCSLKPLSGRLSACHIGLG